MCTKHDTEILAIAEDISNNEIYRRLFDVARRSTDQQIIKFCEFMEAMNTNDPVS